MPLASTRSAAYTIGRSAVTCGARRELNLRRTRRDDVEVLWGIILLIVMYIAIPIAIFAAVLIALGGADRFRPSRSRPASRGSNGTGSPPTGRS